MNFTIKKRERRKYKRESETLRGPISPETFLGHLPSGAMFLKTVLPFLLQDCDALRPVRRPNSHSGFLGLRSKFLRHPCLFLSYAPTHLNNRIPCSTATCLLEPRISPNCTTSFLTGLPTIVLTVYSYHSLFLPNN